MTAQFQIHEKAKELTFEERKVAKIYINQKLKNFLALH
jgi:hypothetical protein